MFENHPVSGVKDTTQPSIVCACLIPAHRKQRQKQELTNLCEFQSSLGYIVRPFLKKKCIHNQGKLELMMAFDDNRESIC